MSGKKFRASRIKYGGLRNDRRHHNSPFLSYGEVKLYEEFPGDVRGATDPKYFLLVGMTDLEMRKWVTLNTVHLLKKLTDKF